VTSIAAGAFFNTGLACLPAYGPDIAIDDGNPEVCAAQPPAAPPPSTPTQTTGTATQTSSCSSCASAVFKAFRQTEAQAKKDGVCPSSATKSSDGKECRMAVDGRFWRFNLN